MVIRQAADDDYSFVFDFYCRLIDEMSDSEFAPGWKKDVYPSRRMIEDAISNGELYVGVADGDIISSMILNHDNNEGYDSVSWSDDFPRSDILVIHALGVLPSFSGRGIARRMIEYAISHAERSGARALRLDVLAGNIPAERVYISSGFVFRGTARMFYDDTGWTDFHLYEFVI